MSERRLLDSVDNIYTTTNTFTLSNPTPTWRWSVFGGTLMVVTISEDQPQPSWRQRLLSRIFLGSRWTRLPERSTVSQ